MSVARVIAVIVAAWMVLLTCGQAQAAEGRKPNVIFILADDLGWTGLGCQGSTYYESPHIDRMASEGMRFTDGYTSAPNCAPTRAALMSGQYGPRTGMYTVGGIDRFEWQIRPLRPVDNVTNHPLDRMLISQAMKNAGYVTGMYGKWHLGNFDDYHPSKRGFDDAIVVGRGTSTSKPFPPWNIPKGSTWRIF